MNVLIVEDDSGIAQAIALTLRLEGHGTTHVATGADALSAPPFDVILLDIGLPDLTGFEVLRRLHDRGDATPVIVMTARHEPELRMRALAGGAAGFILKPFAAGGLLEAIAVVHSPV